MILRPGDRAPDFALADQHGSVITLAEATRGSALVLAFVPFAFSPICGDELADLDRWRTRMHDDSQAVDIVVVSVDSKYTLAAWAQQTGTSLALGSDFWPHGEVASAFGVFDPHPRCGRTRAVFVISAAGTIVSGRQVARSRDSELLRQTSTRHVSSL
jgi:peroxiredoxin